MAFHQGNYKLGDNKISDLSGSTRPCLRIDNNYTTPKCNCGPLVRAGAYGGQVINEILAQVHFTVDPVGP